MKIIQVSLVLSVTMLLIVICSNEPDKAIVNLAVGQAQNMQTTGNAAAQYTPAEVAAITVQVEGQNFVTDPEPINMQTMKTTLVINAGDNTLFTATAYDTGDKALYRGFTRVDLKAGEETNVRIKLNRIQICSYDDDNGVTSDIFNYSPGAPGSEGNEAHDIKDDNSGYLYVVGSARAAGGDVRWLVRQSKDFGRSWATIDDWQVNISDSPDNSEAWAIAADSNNNIYVVGTGGSGKRWLVRKGNQSGNFTLVDTYSIDTAYDSMPYDVAIDSQNNVYVAGLAQTSGSPRWTVRKSSDGGHHFNNIDNYFETNGFESGAYSIYIDSNDRIYVAGFYTNYSISPGSRFMVRVSNDRGVTWSTMPGADFQFYHEANAGINDIHIDTSGYIYLAGYGYDESYNKQGILRRSTNGGTSFETIDTYKDPAWGQAEIRSVLVAPNDMISTTGAGYDGEGPESWIVRLSRDSGVTYKEHKLRAYESGDAQGFRQFEDRQGNLYTTGYQWNESGEKFWGVFTLPCKL